MDQCFRWSDSTHWGGNLVGKVGAGRGTVCVCNFLVHVFRCLIYVRTKLSLFLHPQILASHPSPFTVKSLSTIAPILNIHFLTPIHSSADCSLTAPANGTSYPNNWQIHWNCFIPFLTWFLGSIWQVWLLGLIVIVFHEGVTYWFISNTFKVLHT